MIRALLPRRVPSAGARRPRVVIGGGGPPIGPKSMHHIHQPHHRWHSAPRQHQHAQATSVDIARFGLLSVFSLPFVLWTAAFTYDYTYRVHICQKAVSRVDEELLEEKDADSSGFLGRDNELAEVSSLLEKPPTQIIVVAGGNEAGKSRFIRELLKGTQKRGVTLAQLVDSVNSFTHVLVDAFDLKWLQLRHALVDVLPFAGSEILVMKERFSDRDLAQALVVLTEALKKNAAQSGPDAPRPVIVIDGLGEGPRRWMDSPEGKMLAHRVLQWSIYVTKERKLAHVMLTGSEQLVLSLTDQNRITRGHVRLVGLGDIDLENAAKLVRSELPNATDDEIKRITTIFGGFVHDVKGVSRDIAHHLDQLGKKASKAGSKRRKAVFDEQMRSRMQQQVERVAAAFADAKEDNDSISKGDASVDEEDEDPYLDPLKSIYSEAKASSSNANLDESGDGASWTQLQLWRTLQRLVESPRVPFSELRDDIFDGKTAPILQLIGEDVLSFEIDHRSSDGGWFWNIRPAKPALRLAFAQIVSNSSLKESFQQMEEAEERSAEKKRLELDRARLHRERKNLDMRKKSLTATIELGKEIGQENSVRRRLVTAFKDIVEEEEQQDRTDRLLRDKLSMLAIDGASPVNLTTSAEDPASLQSLLKTAVLDIMSSGGPDGERFSRLKQAFDVLDRTKDGKIYAEDVVRVVKESTGEDVSMAAAEELIKSNDKSLDYYEFVQLLLSDDDRK